MIDVNGSAPANHLREYGDILAYVSSRPSDQLYYIDVYNRIGFSYGGAVFRIFADENILVNLTNLSSLQLFQCTNRHQSVK